MDPIQLLPTAFPFLAQSLSVWFGNSKINRAGRLVIKRALRNELRLNLDLIDFVLAKGNRADGNLPSIFELVNRLETGVSERIFAGVGYELAALGQLDEQTRGALSDEPGVSGLPASILQAEDLDFSELLGFVLRKIAEMRILVLITKSGDATLNPSVQWGHRLDNLRKVMLFLIKNLK